MQEFLIAVLGAHMDRLRRVFLFDGELRSGWRFLIFLVLYQIGEAALNFVLPKLHFPEFVFTWLGLMLNEAVDFALVAAVAWLMSRIEQERFSAYGLPLARGSGRLFAVGVIWGIIPSIVILIPIYLTGGCSFHGLALHGADLAVSAVTWAFAFVVMGFSEEFLFRGYTLKTLAEGIGFWPAAAVLSCLFGLVHLIFKPDEGWIDPISVSLYGLFWCLTLRRTGSLWFAIGFHAASDYADMIIFAEPNTGNAGKPLAGHLLNVQFHGPAWLTGGPRGTEASVLVFLVLAALFYLFHHAYPPVKNGSPKWTRDKKSEHASSVPELSAPPSGPPQV